MIKAVTHSGIFHPDDVFAGAVLKIIYGDEITFIRTRDEEVIKKGDIVFDVGYKYDPENNLFDHHQIDGAGERNGVKYAAFGLIWKKFGEEICGSARIRDIIDTELVQFIDGTDNGQEMFDVKRLEWRIYTVGEIIDLFNPTWKEGGVDRDSAFLDAVSLAKKILEREIKNEQDRVEADMRVREICEKLENKRILILDSFYPWGKTLEDCDDVLFVVYPATENDKWGVYTVKDGQNTFKRRKLFPKEWWGKRGEELAVTSGVKDAIFVHRDGFIAAAKTKEGAIKLAEIALKS